MQVIDMTRQFAFLTPFETPILSMLLAANRRKFVTSPEFKFAEGDRIARVGEMDTNAAGANPMDVQSGLDSIGIGSVLKLRNASGQEEVVHVTAVDRSGGTVTVTHQIGGGSAIATTAGDPLFILGNSLDEGGETPEGITADYLDKDGYIQEASDTLSHSWIQEKSTGVPGSSRAEKRTEVGETHKMFIESALIHGKLHKYTSGSDTYRFTDGVINRISSNISDLGTISKTKLDTFIGTSMQYGARSRMLFCGSTLYQAIHDLMDESVTFDQDVQVFGWRIQTYRSAFGDVQLFYHRQLTGDYASYGLLLDMDQLTYCTMDGLDTQLISDVQTRRTRGVADEWYTAFGLMMKNEQAHGICYVS
jgi:hypothetical protein